jgi:uncharacterized membrane protein
MGIATYDRLLNSWIQLKTSLWFVPALMTAGGGAIAVSALRIDSDLLPEGERVWWLYSGKPDSASELLSTLLSSIITMATLAVSITMVVLTLAASQLGPRLIRSFIGNRRTQVSLGFFIMTIVYLLLVYRRVDDHLDVDNVPHVAITLGSALSLTCVFLLLFHVHHLASSIVSDTVINRVGDELDGILHRLLPEPGSTAPRDAWPEGDTLSVAGGALSLPRGGYVQTIDYGTLVEVAHGCDVVLTLRFRAGWHLLAGGSHVLVHPEGRANDELAARIATAVILGTDRTPTQDLEFSIRQLVEIALRALSPGINDPYTAVAVIDRLAASLALAMQRDMEPALHRDGDGAVRVVARPSTFTGLVDRSFNEIRQSASGTPAILIHLLDAIADLACFARTREQRDALARHAAMIASAGDRTIKEEQDLMAISKRYDAVVRGLRPESVVIRARKGSPQG